MPAIRLETKRVEKPWGRHDLWPGFDDVPEGGKPIGEVWFQTPKGIGQDDPELLIKYLFTAEKLSVQVHPTDDYARAHGHERGKSEAWQILAAEPHATIAIGTLAPMTKDELREDAEDGRRRAAPRSASRRTARSSRISTGRRSRPISSGIRRRARSMRSDRGWC